MLGNRIPTYPALLADEAAFNALPLQTSPPPLWTDISARALGPWSTERGTDYWLSRTTAGLIRPVYDNRDGGLDPDNAAGPYYPNAQPYRGLRKRMRFSPNLLTADQASGGEFSSLSGPVPLADLNVINDAGYPLSIVTSGSAYQGTQVYQATLPNGATTFATVLLLKAAAVIPRQTYSVQAQARITSGNSVSTQVSVLWYDNLGNSLGSTAGGAQTLTSGAGTWTQLTCAGVTAPAGAFSAWLKVQIASGTLTGSTVWQVDGLQWEQSLICSPWQMPGTLGANLLPQPIATGTASIDPTKDSAANYFASAAGSVAQATNLAAAPTGSTTAVAWTTPSGTTSSSPLYCGVVGTGAPSILGPVADCTQVTAGAAYSASVYLTRASSADATVQVQASIKWFDANGNTLSAPSGGAVTVPVGSWARATLANATAPAGAVWGRVRIFISTPASTTATNVIYATGWQLEKAAAVSAWVDPGPTWFAWTGFFDQYPQGWRLSGTYGELDAVGVDALAGLAQYDVLDPLIEEILAYGPTFLYPLNDPVGSVSCVDATGNRVPAPVENSPFGPGTLTFGNGVTSVTPGATMQGSAGPVATFTNNPGDVISPPSQLAETFVAIGKTTANPGPPANGNWTRIVHFRCATAPGASQAYSVWEALPPSFQPGNTGAFNVGIVSSPAGSIDLFVSGSSGSGVTNTNTTNYCDGNWHQAAISVDGSGNVAMYMDGAAVPTSAASITLPISGCTSDTVGTSVQYGAQIFRSGLVGDVACVAEFPSVLTAAQIANLYNSFRSASSGESSGARVQRLLNWIGYQGPVSIDSGSTQTMGPASDLAHNKALTGFNAIVDTENGDGFASSAGVLTFKARSARYNSSPLFVFGENTQWGEWPYRAGDGDLLLPTDVVNTYNIVPTQQYSTGQSATARDSAAGNADFPRTLPTRVINSTSFAEVQGGGQYLLSQLKTPRKRLAQMILDVSAVPGLWRVAAQLDKGVRIRVMKRPPWGAGVIQFDGFVERVLWAGDPRSSGGVTTVTVEASPADPVNYWTLAPLHVTLHAQAASGQNQASINALPDAAYNKLAQSLAQGQQFTFEPGTPRQETMTVAPTGVPSTSLGYTSATLTFTANFAFTHGPNSVVTEPLPAGYTDPTVWDANSVLGVSYTTVLSGGGSGTNTVTVGPLQDAAVNPLGSVWNEGDQITLSAATANVETMTIQSVAATLPGYTSCLITFTANLAHSHAPGDWVCDPLPAGVNSPTAVAATTRVSY